MVSPTSKQTPNGKTERIFAEEATLVVLGIPVGQFDGFSLDIEDPSEKERAVNGDAIHFDEFIEPSGSGSIYPTDPAASAVYAAILNRQISNVQATFPENDARDVASIRGCRFSNIEQEDLQQDGYMITFDWEGDFVNSIS